jgi:UDP-N-acetylmuramoyl-tripeptide--D-alanyl-D-alanine ligase
MKKISASLVLSYIRFFARRALAKHNPKIIGITGSAGKSSARTILYAILKDHFSTKMISGNSETGVPLGILGMKPDSYTPLDWMGMLIKAPFQIDYIQKTKYLIVEMGIDDPYPPKNMEYLLTIVQPDIAIFLNAFAGAVHSQQFEKILPPNNTFSDEEKREKKAIAIASEKAKIITQSECTVGIYNGDNRYVSDAIALWENTKNIQLLTFGEKHTDSLAVTGYAVSPTGTTFTFTQKEPKEIFSITIANYLLQKEYGQTIAAAILAAQQTSLSLNEIKKSLQANFSLPKSRATMLKGIENTIIIDSSYNASRTAVEGMLDMLADLKKQTKKPTVFLFGDMRELGEESKVEHEKVAEKMFGIVDYLYIVGAQTREYVLPVIQTNEKVFKEMRWFDNASRAGEFLQEHLPKDALVLVKGSQNTIFLEEAIKYILADKKDESKLCRQEPFWLAKKK